MEKLKHWTSNNTNAFVHRISSDFVAQLENKLQEIQIDHAEFSERLGVTPGRVSQVLNNPGNLTLKNVVQYVRALGMKVAIVAYEDGDPNNENGPINSAIFCDSWKQIGAPKTFYELSHVITPVGDLGYSSVATNTGLDVRPLKLEWTAFNRPSVDIRRKAHHG